MTINLPPSLIFPFLFFFRFTNYLPFSSLPLPRINDTKHHEDNGAMRTNRSPTPYPHAHHKSLFLIFTNCLSSSSHRPYAPPLETYNAPPLACDSHNRDAVGCGRSLSHSPVACSNGYKNLQIPCCETASPLRTPPLLRCTTTMATASLKCIDANSRALGSKHFYFIFF